LNEIIIELQEISPKEFFGTGNENITLLKKYFPKLKIVARGNTIKAFGDEELLDEFDRRMTMLLKHFSKYNKLDENVIERVLTSQSSDDYNTSEKSGEVLVHGANGKPIKAITANQRKMVELMRKNDMVFAIGPAGTGKTYTGVALAVKALKNKEVKRIILTRPAVEAGENLGFLPGDLKEKLAQYIENGTIQIAPLAFMRGRTLDHAFVILDEGQNTTHAQMKMFLTRMGKSAKFLLTGDPGQIDLPRRTISGLKEALLILKGVEGVGMIFLDDKDVVRHKLVKKIIEAYKNIENRE